MQLTENQSMIRQMAREMAAAAPAVAVFPGRRTSWYTNDTIFRQSMGMLTGLLGAVDAPGAAYFGGDKAKLGSYRWAIEPVELAPKFDGFSLAAEISSRGLLRGVGLELGLGLARPVLLVGIEQLDHLPELALLAGGLGRLGR